MTQQHATTTAVTESVLADRLDGWIDTTRALAAEAGMATAAADLTALATHATRATVRIAVAGDLVKARHALINDLVGVPVLQNGGAVLQNGGAEHNTVPTLVSAGPDEQWEAVGADGRREQRRSEGARSIRVTVRSEALERLGVELVDVGLVDLTQRAADPGRLAVTGSDAVIVVVSATAAMTLSEVVFIEQCLARAHVPRVLVAVANLDLIDPEEQKDLLGYVHTRAADISPMITVLAREPGKQEQEEAWIREEVLPERIRRRPRQVAGQLTESLRQVAVAARQAGQTARQEDARRTERRDAAELAIGDELSVFDGVRTALQDRRNRAVADFRAGSDHNRRQFGAALLHELQRVGDPRQWWEAELPHRMQVQLADWASRAQATMRGQIEQDVSWLDGELVRIFQLRIERPAVFAAPNLSAPAAPAIKLADLRGRKMLYRLGPSGLALVAIVAVPPIAPVAAICASMIGTGLAELRLRGLLDEQRREIRARLPRLVDDVYDGYSAAVAEQVDLVYRHFQDEVLRLRQVWRRSRQDQLHEDPGPAGGSEATWRQLADRADTLTRTIQTAIKRAPTGAAETATTQEQSA